MHSTALTKQQQYQESQIYFFKGGAVYETARKQVIEDGVFGEYLSYPVGDKSLSELTDVRVAAELFARIGVLYSANNRLAEQVFPELKGIYDVRQTSIYGSSDELSDQVPRERRNGKQSAEARSQYRTDGLTNRTLGKVGDTREASDGQRVSISRQSVLQGLGITENSQNDCLVCTRHVASLFYVRL